MVDRYNPEPAEPDKEEPNNPAADARRQTTEIRTRASDNVKEHEAAAKHHARLADQHRKAAENWAGIANLGNDPVPSETARKEGW